MPQSLLATANRALGAAYPVTLPAFEGPLDLLLQLIEKQELDISAISLMAVTDQYIATLSHLEEIEPGALADFLVIASRLLYLKSLRLLPRPQSPGSSEEDEAGDALIKQLLEYRRFKKVAAELQAREAQGLRVYVRSAPRPVVEKRLDLSNVNLDKLHAALRRALQRIPSTPPMPRVKTYAITVAEQIAYVRDYLHQAQAASVSAAANAPPFQVSFVELLGQSSTRLEVVVTFLAILELIKQEEVMAVQDGVFGEIVLMLTAADNELYCG